ncbi:hypothetical protein Tsubulata_038589, partial [Turnera subulata]
MPGTGVFYVDDDPGCCSDMSFTSLLALADDTGRNVAWTDNNGCHHTLEQQQRRAANAFSCQKVTPVTPNEAMRRECKDTDMQNLSPGERAGRETNENIIAGTDNLQTGEQLKNSVTETKENDYPEKEGCRDIDLNKTPQQKPRKKKHRPKVIAEDTPRRTPKAAASPKENPTGKRKYVRKKAVSAGPTILSEEANANGECTDPNVVVPLTPNLAASEKKPTGKRKYVRKKPLNKASATPPAEATGDLIDPEVLEHGKKPRKRA